MKRTELKHGQEYLVCTVRQDWTRASDFALERVKVLDTTMDWLEPWSHSARRGEPRDYTLPDGTQVKTHSEGAPRRGGVSGVLVLVWMESINDWGPVAVTRRTAHFRDTWENGKQRVADERARRSREAEERAAARRERLALERSVVDRLGALGLPKDAMYGRGPYTDGVAEVTVRAADLSSLLDRLGVDG